jgi:hypothetical protein
MGKTLTFKLPNYQKNVYTSIIHHFDGKEKKKEMIRGQFGHYLFKQNLFVSQAYEIHIRDQGEEPAARICFK